MTRCTRCVEKKLRKLLSEERDKTAKLQAENAKLQAELEIYKWDSLEAALKEITKLKAENAKLQAVVKRAKVLLDDATYHDGRYDQHTDAAWQKEACAVVKAIKEVESGD